MNTKHRLLATFGLLAAGALPAAAQNYAITGPEIGNPTSAQLLAGWSSPLASNPHITVTIQASGTFDPTQPTATSAGFSNGITGTGTNLYTVSFLTDSGWVVDQLVLNNYNGINPSIQESYSATLNGATWSALSGADASYPYLVVGGLGTSTTNVTTTAGTPLAQFFDITSTVNPSGINSLTYTYTKGLGGGYAVQPLGFTIHAVPEVSTSLLGVLGLTATCFRRRRPGA